MAQTSGQFSGSIRNGYQQLIVQWTATQDITNNKSIITANMYLKSSGGLSIGPRDNTTTIDGIAKYYASGSISKSSSFNMLLGTVSQDVQHNNDGTKTFSMSSVFNIQATLGGVYYANITANSGNIELPTIPRASSITVNDANIGSATNIVINKTSSNFTTTLYYKASGQNSWTKIVDKTSNQVYGWTVPASFYAMIPNSKTITCQFKAETYNGDTLVGTSDIVTATFTATGNPIINSYTLLDINEVTVDLTGDNTKMIKGVSEVELTMNLSAQNSAGIKEVIVNGGTYIYDVPPATIEDISSFENCNTNIFNATIKDTRGNTTSDTFTMPMVNYVPLTLNPTIVRDTPTNEKINISFNGNYYNDSFGAQNNTLTVQYRYKESTSSTWGSWTTISNTKNGNTYSGYAQLSNMDYQKIYNFEMRATDKIGTKSVTGITISKGEPVYWWDENGLYVKDTLKIGNSNVATASDIGNATITIQKNGSIVDSFTTNTSSDKTINIPVPTKTSDLTNDTADFMVVMNNANQTIRGNNTSIKYNLNTVKTSNGSKLTFDSTNHGVNIGSGVSYVEASAMVYVNQRGASSNNVLYIYKNDTQVARVNHSIPGDYESIMAPPIIIPVQQNDKIYVYIRSSAGSNTNVVFGGNTDGVDYLTVKVIK